MCYHCGMQKKWMIPILAGGAVAAAGFPYRFDITHYEIHSDSIKTPVKAVVLADLHNERYGPHMKRLIRVIRNEQPDLILMPGDMCDIDHQEANTLELFRSLNDIPMYYATGNHEEFRNDLSHLLSEIRKTGVKIPEHSAAVFEKNDSKLEILSIPCYKKMSWFSGREISEQYHTSNYRILLSHRPEWDGLYRDIDCDLVICGHAHGGQWRIPVLDQGVFAPEQGLDRKSTRLNSSH